MAITSEVPAGPDFSEGVPVEAIPPGGSVAGRAGARPVILSRFGDGFFAVDGRCTHYGGALADGLIRGETVICPRHHACFSLRSGAALRAPAFAPLGRWRVEVEAGRVFVRGKREPAPNAPARGSDELRSIVIVGGGAAGFAAAERLRTIGYDGALTLLSRDPAAPCDRPNLSKDYLAGTAPEEWLPLADEAFYRDRAIDLRLDAEAVAIDVDDRAVRCASGERVAFDRLLLATGAEPVRLRGPGLEAANVFTLRSPADSRALAGAAEGARRAAVVGCGFIGLEAAAALRHRGLEVEIVARDELPLERVLGREVGQFLKALHERNGVRFSLGRSVTGFDGRRLNLSDGTHVEADFVLVGIGVRPNVELAVSAGLEVGDGILVDRRLETSVAGIYAAGDAAGYPDPLTGERVRTEHWVTAQRQGQVCAENMLGAAIPFVDPPFFWTEQHGTALRYVGRAPAWDSLAVQGSIADGDFAISYLEGGIVRAVLSCGRDLAGLEAEALIRARIGDAAGTSVAARHQNGG